MKQDFPAGKAVEPRHLQKFRVYAPHAVAQVDHHRRNGGCGHDEYTGPAVKPKPYQSQHNPAYRRHRLEHMDEWRPHILQFGAQAEQQTQNGTHRNPDPKAERQAQQGGTDGGPEVRLPDQPRQRARDLWNGREHQRGETERGQLPDTQQQAHAQGAAEPEGRLTPHSITRRRGVFRRSSRGQSR